MKLKEYRKKRDFKRTPEPQGNGRSAPGRQYVVQKHAARRLHYDFRLELDGVLKSWAVPKGPSLDPAVKSLAVHVEDHPLEYGSFEGVIPEGEYGGGTVMIWDHGAWEPEGDPVKAYKKGKLKFRLHGEKLKGRWALIRMHGEAGEGGKNWLLKKLEDDAARPEDEFDVLEEHADSVATGREMDEIAEDADRVWSSDGEVASKGNPDKNGHSPSIDPAALNGVVRRNLPRAFKPQLATLAPEAPPGEEWLHELKFDGYRLLCRFENGQVRLMTRRGNDWTERFPRVAEAAAQLGWDQTMLDGEVVVMAKDGTSDFQALQNLLRSSRDDNVVFYVFDLPLCQGYDLMQVPLVQRKELLARLMQTARSDGAIRYSDHIKGQGPEVFQHACRHGLEGIVSKRADSLYEQRRSRSWLKVKCLKRQEFVIGGWTEPSGSRKGFGALLLGYYDGDRLIYCGRVGTGFSSESLDYVKSELDKLGAERPPFDNPPKGSAARDVHWVEPKLVAEVEFSNWTDDGLLRHPSFQGLREEKEPKEVTREEPVEVVPDQSGENRPRRTRAGASEGNVVAGVRLSNPDRVVYPDQGLTKLDLAEYYAEVADWIMPHLVDRPLTLVRCPRGRAEKCFYQKHVSESIPKPVVGIEVEKKGGTGIYVSIRDVAGLVTLVQLGVLEIHPWGSRKDKLDRPDRMIFDLDPGEGVAWAAVVQAARELHERLNDLKLESFLRTTGGKGLHLVLPLARRATWDEVKAFSRAIADSMVRDDREKYIATSSKAKRQGKIYVDYLRNDQGATSIANYSTRARHGAPVAVPLRWDELSSKLKSDAYNVQNVRQRLASLEEDPWQGFSDVRQSISKALQRKVAARS